MEDENSEGSPFAFPRDGGWCIPRHSTSSLRIVPPPLPQRAATTLINYPNFLIQATFDIDRTTLETVEKRCRWTGPAPEVQPSS